jgi:hypothetical protein
MKKKRIGSGVHVIVVIIIVLIGEQCLSLQHFILQRL